MEEIHCYYTVVEKAFDRLAPYYDLRVLHDSFDVSGISFALHDMPLTIRQTVLIEIQAELSVLLGAGRVWKGTKW